MSRTVMAGIASPLSCACEEGAKPKRATSIARTNLENGMVVPPVPVNRFRSHGASRKPAPRAGNDNKNAGASQEVISDQQERASFRNEHERTADVKLWAVVMVNTDMNGVGAVSQVDQGCDCFLCGRHMNSHRGLP